jgi:hypothetical protein
VKPSGLLLAVLATVVNVVLVNWSRPIFGGYWQYVMWEGGVVENLTALQFLAGAAIFASCALQRWRPPVERRWLGLYALGELVLAGEETNYGRGTLFLDLGNPNFARDYNPQSGNLHNLLIEASIPVIVFMIAIVVLRRFYTRIVTRLRLPLPAGFLDAGLVTAVGIVAMRFDDGRYLSVDEVYEWSGALLLLALALHCRLGWFFHGQPGPAAERVNGRSSVDQSRRPPPNRSRIRNRLMKFR